MRLVGSSPAQDFFVHGCQGNSEFRCSFWGAECAFKRVDWTSNFIVQSVASEVQHFEPAMWAAILRLSPKHEVLTRLKVIAARLPNDWARLVLSGQIILLDPTQRIVDMFWLDSGPVVRLLARTGLSLQACQGSM